MQKFILKQSISVLFVIWQLLVVRCVRDIISNVSDLAFWGWQALSHLSPWQVVWQFLFHFHHMWYCCCYFLRQIQFVFEIKVTETESYCFHYTVVSFKYECRQTTQWRHCPLTKTILHHNFKDVMRISLLRHLPVCACCIRDTAGRIRNFLPSFPIQQRSIVLPNIWYNWSNYFCVRTWVHRQSLVCTCWPKFPVLVETVFFLFCKCCVSIILCWYWLRLSGKFVL